MGSNLKQWMLAGLLLASWLASSPTHALEGWPPQCSEKGVLTSENFAGPEDITVDTVKGIAYISAVDRSVTPRLPSSLGPDEYTRQSKLGGIFRYRMDGSGGLEAMKIVPEGAYNANFFPHGISLLKREGDMDLLFVISHPVTERGTMSYVEIFAIDETAAILHRIDSIADPGDINLNDLVAIGPRQFYATDNHDLNALWSVLGGKGGSRVRYFDGTYYRTVVDGLAFANGITTDGTHLFVAEALENRILSYDISPANSAVLTLLSTLKLSAAPDNLEWAEQDRSTMLVGAHPSLFRFVIHAMAPALFDAPSRVIAVPYLALVEGIMIDEIVEHDIDEELLSATSVATIYNGKIMMGAVFDRKALICDMQVRPD